MKASSAWFVLVVLLLLTGAASAGRKRIVVLDFEGDKAEQFHEDVVKLIKKSHTVVSLDKWNGTAEEMSATKLTDKNIKKVARKLKVDGVVSGIVEKRRDEFILRIKLRSGVSGELVGGQVNVKSESAKIDSTAAKDIKDELIEVIAGLESNRDGGGSDDEEEKPKKSTPAAKKPSDDEEEKPKKGTPAKKPSDDEEEKPKKGFGKKPIDDEEKPKKGTPAKKPSDDEEKPKKGTPAAKKPSDDEEKPKKGTPAKKPSDDEVALKPKKEPDEKPKKPSDDEEGDKPSKGNKGKKVAAKPKDGEEGGELEGGGEVTPLEGDAMYAPSERAIDAAVGLSFTARRMAFAYDPAKVTTRPAGYRQSIPVPGAFIDATVFPLAYGHKRKDILRHIGGTLMFDRVIGLNSKNPNDGTKLSTTAQRFAVGGVFRYPLGEGAKAPVVGGSLRLGNQSFSISGQAAIPNVSYTSLEVSGFIGYPLSPKMVLGATAGGMLPFGAGDITQIAQYGRASLTGFEFSGGLDYMLMKNVFARAEARFETIGYAFKGEGMKGVGVSGARDTYYGGALTGGFLF